MLKCFFFMSISYPVKKISLTFFLRLFFVHDISALSGSIIFLIASGTVGSLISKLKKSRKVPF